MSKGLIKRLKSPFLVFLFFAALISIGVLAWQKTHRTSPYLEPLKVVTDDPRIVTPKETAPTAKAKVSVNNVIIPVEVVSSYADVQKGLSGRTSLQADTGMLFLFARPSRYQFWMPDMYFPIDIIWIEEGKVADISANVSNEFDPKNPKFYRPRVPVQYVLEVNAHFAKEHGISIGSSVEFIDIK